MSQNFTSKMTSINTKKLPAIYKKLDWRKLVEDNFLANRGCLKIVDWGCGRETDHIRKFLDSVVPFQEYEYHPYDPYWLSEKDNAKALIIVPDIYICSNVLNVIDDDRTMNSIHDRFLEYKNRLGTKFFITVYEGDKSGISQESKSDCWQRNQTIDFYMRHMSEDIRKKVLCHSTDIKYII